MATGLEIQFLVGQPTGSATVGQDVSSLGGRSGELVTSLLHGKYYPAAYAGKAWMLATAPAGTTIPVQASNLVSTFTLLNPITSNVNVELLRYSLGVTNATTVVSDISLYWQNNIGNGNSALASTTSLTIRNAVLGAGGAPQSSGYSAATFTNTIGTNMFRGPTLASFGATTTSVSGPINYDFDGMILLPPGTAVTVAGTAAQTQAMTQSLMFVEWPA